MWYDSSTCHVYVMWAELGHSQFLYVPAVLYVLKWNPALGFEFSIKSSVYGSTTVVKVSLFSTWTRSTLSVYSMCKCRNQPVQTMVFSTQTNLVFLGPVNVTMITGTRSLSTVVRCVTGV